jgi:hypothetical protein
MDFVVFIAVVPAIGEGLADGSFNSLLHVDVAFGSNRFDCDGGL